MECTLLLALYNPFAHGHIFHAGKEKEGWGGGFLFGCFFVWLFVFPNRYFGQNYFSQVSPASHIKITNPSILRIHVCNM